MAKNKLDDYSASVISIVPFEIHEYKYGIYPGDFKIPKSEKEVPEILLVKESIYYVEIDETRTIQVKCTPNDVAKAIVEDYLSANLAYNLEANASPGVFWRPGNYDIERVYIECASELDEMKIRQRNWFENLVRMADDDWEHTRQHKMISDTQRYAAKAMGLERPWLIQPQVPSVAFIKCIACQSMVSPEAIICPNCKMIFNMDKYNKLAFVKV